ncbi:MAG: hypothetical protein ACPGU0_03210 [Marinirhabdus sp.]
MAKNKPENNDKTANKANGDGANETGTVQNTGEGKERTTFDGPENDNLGIPEEILDAIPAEDRGKFVSIMQQSMFASISRRKNPLTEKITTEHITTLISNSDKNDKRDRQERKSERNYNLILILIGLVFIGFLVVFLQTNIDLLITVITAILSFIGGFGFGKSAKKGL